MERKRIHCAKNFQCPRPARQTSPVTRAANCTSSLAEVATRSIPLTALGLDDIPIGEGWQSAHGGAASYLKLEPKGKRPGAESAASVTHGGAHQQATQQSCTRREWGSRARRLPWHDKRRRAAVA